MSEHFVYLLAGDERSRDLALAEARAVCGAERISDRLVRADRRARIERTGYLAGGIEVLAEAPDVESACEQVARIGLHADDFAIDVVRIPQRLKVSRRETANALALVLDGRPNLDDPAERFTAYVTANGVWFGPTLDAPEREWKRFVEKLHECSCALPGRVARAVCNLVVRGGERVVDPCCGSGTLLLNAADLGASVTGFDVNKKMVGATNANLLYFGFRAAAEQADAAEVTGEYDLVVTNLPYGKMSAVTPAEEGRLVRNIVPLAPRGVLVTTSHIAEPIAAAGAHVEQTIPLSKFTMTRYIYVYLEQANNGRQELRC
ncbi:MAG: TRM11 family SAM-dependent methyltransferase [Planctomycetota bacterium]